MAILELLHQLNRQGHTIVLVTHETHIAESARRQIRLFDMLPMADAFRVDGDHDAVVANANRFVPSLLRAVRSVETRDR